MLLVHLPRLLQEAQRRREKLHAFLQHPGWIAVAPTMLCVYSHFTFGLATLSSIVFHQIVFLRPPSDFTQVPVTVGLLVTALLSGSVARRSLKNSMPALALLFDLCCLGLVVVWTPSFLRWTFCTDSRAPVDHLLRINPRSSRTGSMVSSMYSIYLARCGAVY